MNNLDITPKILPSVATNPQNFAYGCDKPSILELRWHNLPTISLSLSLLTISLSLSLKQTIENKKQYPFTKII